MEAREEGSPEKGLRGPLVCKAVGITYRQLDYWARTGLVVPSVRDATGSGSQRLYSFNDVLQLRIVRSLLGAGVSLQQIRRALDYVRNELNTPLEQVKIFSDGTKVYAFTSDQEILDLLQKGQAVFGIAVPKVHEELQGKIAQLRPEEEGEGEADAEAGR